MTSKLDLIIGSDSDLHFDIPDQMNLVTPELEGAPCDCGLQDGAGGLQPTLGSGPV